MNVTVEKVKVVKAPETVKPDTKAEAPVAQAKTETKPTILEKLEGALNKLMGSYDGKYQEVEEPKKEEVPGVPGTKEEETAPEGGEKPEGEKLEGSYDGKYQEEPEAKPEAEEECCPHCGSKMKKAQKKAEEKEGEEEEKKEEKHAEEEVLPTKAETSAEKPDLSVDAWRSNFFAAGVKPSPRNVDWAKACEAFTNSPSKQ
jgi:hypothetical protein